MAWFGEGFTSLKGQITNLTKEIVANNVVGLGSFDNTENEENASAPNDDESQHLDRLKLHCKTQDEEIAKLREDNGKLRRLLAKSPRDRRVSEEATLECEDVPTTNANLPLVPLDEAGTDSFLGQDQVPKDVKAEEEISSLRSRLRKTFQEKVLMEQSCSRLEKEVALLTQQVTEDRQQAQAGVEARRNAEAVFRNNSQATQTESSSSGGGQPPASPDMAQLMHENNQLKRERAQLRGELARLSRTVQELESQVAVSQDENANLSTGMEELDIQHQQAIEQIMVLKDSTQKRYEILQVEYDEMKENYEKLVKSCEEIKNNKSHKHVECQTSADQPSEVKSQILINLSEEIKSMITTEIPDKYFETSKENASGLETVAAVEKMLSHTMARVEANESKIRELLKELRRKDEEAKEIEDENRTLCLKLGELKEQCENLPTIAENGEVEAMENRILTLENEVSILREVRSNLEVEHSNSRSEIESLIRRLQTAEAVNRNNDNLQTEILKYKESEQELLNKLSDAEQARKEILSEMTHLQTTFNEQENCISDLKHNKLKLEEITQQNRQLEEALTQSKEIELLYLKVSEELQYEKMLKAKLEEEKEKMHSELTKFESLEQSLKQSNELQQEQIIREQLEGENDQLKQLISTLQETEKENVKSLEKLRTEFEDQLEIMQTEIKRLEKVEDTLKQLLEQKGLESDMKVKDLKALNTCLSQKCVKFEKEVLDLSEQADSLKIENDSKDRKLCEMILEKSVTDKELEKVQIIKDNLEKEFNSIKDEISSKEAVLFQGLKHTIERHFGASVSEKLGSEFASDNLQSCFSEVADRLTFFQQENDSLVRKISSLTESTQKLTCELNDKSDCLMKLNAQIGTLQAEKHSIEDKLRNLRETVSTGNQTDQPDGPEITLESYTDLQSKLEGSERRFIELEDKYQKLLTSSDQSLTHVNDQLRNLHNERQQLIEAVRTKHAECVNYHTEIQRLCAELSKAEKQKSTLTSQFEQQLEEKDDQLSSLQASSDRQVAALNEQLHTLQNQLDYVSQLLRVTDRQEAEGQPANDSTSANPQAIKTEIEEKEAKRVEELYESLQQEQLRNKYLQDEVSEQHEKEGSLLKELERLRGHLVAVEDNYTQEMVRAEQQVQELTQRLALAEERAKSSSTAYTSASIRANQQVEVMSGQLRQLTEQKEKMSAQLAAAEDKLHKQAAALTNLQIVLEQFQRDKERDVAMENERIRQTLQLANNKNSELLNEIKALQLQLKEAKEGLSAASRLTEQLDNKTRVITELKQQVGELTEKLKKAEERIQAASVSVEGKVDRCLVRNLVVGYVSAPVSSQQQALNIIATVLDFTPDDRQRCGIDPNTKFTGLKQQSLSEAFVRFLENESRPQPQLRLPLPESEGSRSRKTSVNEMGLPPARRTSGSVLKDVLKQDI